MFSIPPVVWFNIGLLVAAILAVWLGPWFITIAATRWWEGKGG